MGSGGKQLELSISRDAHFRATHELRNLNPPLISRTIQGVLADLMEAIETTRGADGWSEAGQEVYAARIRKSVKTVARRLQTLADLQFIETAPGAGPGDCRRVRPHWPAVAAVVRSRGGFRAPRQGAGLLPDDPGEPIRKEAGDFFSPDPPDKCPVHHLPLLESLNKDTIVPLPLTINGEESLVTQRPDNCPARPDIFSLAFESLANANRLQEWFEWAVATGKAQECDRFRIFAQARSTWRRSKESAKLGRPAIGVGAFLANVKSRRWFASQSDDDWARAAIRYLDREESGL